MTDEEADALINGYPERFAPASLKLADVNAAIEANWVIRSVLLRPH